MRELSISASVFLCTIILIISSYETEDIKGIIGERRTA
jgi:hypothetical protein